MLDYNQGREINNASSVFMQTQLHFTETDIMQTSQV